VVEHRNSVTIVPLDSDGNLWFVRQYRHPVGGKSVPTVKFVRRLVWRPEIYGR
jgi:hypothetical protein